MLHLAMKTELRLVAQQHYNSEVEPSLNVAAILISVCSTCDVRENAMDVIE
jgi:hypothetical protein